MHGNKRKNSSVYGNLSITQEEKNAKQSESLPDETADSDNVALEIGKLSIELESDEEEIFKEGNPWDGSAPSNTCLT